MQYIPLNEIFSKMPVGELERSLDDFLSPLTQLLPEKQLRQVVPLAIRGILVQATPVMAAMAQSVSRQEMGCWAAAKRLYRFMSNKRFNHHQLYR